MREMTACAIPIALMTDIREDPPLEINNNGTPVKGINPVTPPIFKIK